MRRDPAKLVARALGSIVAVGAVAAMLVSVSGCRQALFPESAPRTQFDRYDAQRSGASPAEEPDVFGRPQPALRARLSPKTPQEPVGTPVSPGAAPPQ